MALGHDLPGLSAADSRLTRRRLLGNFGVAAVGLSVLGSAPPGASSAGPAGEILRFADLLERFGLQPEQVAEEPVPVEDEPEIIPRDEWGAIGDRGDRIGQVGRVVVHHFQRPNVSTRVATDVEVEVLRRVERVHLERGFRGLGYSFVVFQSGRIYQSRGWGREGAHTKGRNDRSIGIAFAIDGDRVAPTDEAWVAARRLVALGVARGHLDEDLRITGHRDHAVTRCPGRHVASRLGELAPN